MKMLNLKLINLLIALLIFQGCVPDSLTKFKKDEPVKIPKSTATTSVVDDTPSPTAPPDLTTLETFQLRNITQKSTSYHLHKYGVGNTTRDCEIPISLLADGSTQLTDQTNDILCWLEADELQLFFNGVDFQINTPAGQCDYIRVRPYYFWTLPPANSTKIVKNVTCDDTAHASCIALGGASVANTQCVGDYTSIEGPNCDEGYVTVNSYSVTDGKVSFDTKTSACGGKRVNCYAGPGVDFSTTKNGYPRPVDYLAYNGESINYSVTAPGPLGKGFASNHYISNFTQTYSTGLNSYDYTVIGSISGMERYSKTSATSSKTYANINDTTFDTNSGLIGTSIAAVDYGGDPLKSANATLRKKGTETWETLVTPTTYNIQPFYEFSCLNYASEVKARIRVQIREWNEKFTIPVTSEVTESAPAKLIKQSANATDYETSGIDYWNDVSNWDTPFEYGPSAGYVPLMPTAVGDEGFLFPALGTN